MSNHSSADFIADLSFDQKLIHEIEQTFPTLQSYHHNETEKTKAPVAKLSLKQRFAEFLFSSNKPFQSIGSATGRSAEGLRRSGSLSGLLHGSSSLSSLNAATPVLDHRFTPKTNALDIFKDIVPSLKVSLHKDHILLSVGDASAVKIDEHAERFMYYVEKQQIPPSMEEMLLGILIKNVAALPSLFIEGCFCVEVVDSRTGLGTHRKVLLRPSWSTTVVDVQMMRDILPAYGLSEREKNRVITEIERKIVFAVAEPLVLEPTARVLPALTTFRFNASTLKEESVFQHRNSVAPKFGPQLCASSGTVGTSKREADSFRPKFTCLTVLEEFRNRKINGDIEFLPADGSTRDPLPKIQFFNLCGNVVQSVVRTIRFERTADEKIKQPQYVSLFITSNGTVQTRFDGVIMWGTKVDSSLNGWSQRFCIGNIRMVENYVAFFKNLLFLYDQNMKLVSDSAVLAPKQEYAAFRPQSAGKTPVGAAIPMNPLGMPMQQVPVAGHAIPRIPAGAKFVAKDASLSLQHPSPTFPSQPPTASRTKAAPPPQPSQSPVGIAPHLIFSQ